MGQAYTVEAVVIPKLESATANRLQRYIIENPAKADFKKPTEKSLVGYLRVVLGDSNWSFDAETNKYTADFDGSYGWETQMHRMFEYIADTLEVGSSLEVWPDEGSWCLRVRKDGTVG